MLIADDEPDLVEVYVAFLDDDVHVKTALNGRGALDQLDDSVDIVTLDRRMPGLSGDTVAEHIDKHDIDCKVILISAVSPDDMDYPACDQYLEKPVEPDEFRQAIHELT